MTDRLTPAMLRDLAHLHRVWKSIPEGALSWDEFLDTRANADGERKEAARREAEGQPGAALDKLANGDEWNTDAPPPTAPFVTDHKWLDPECHASGCQTLILKAELEKLRDQRDKYMWQVRDTCARAEAAEAREKRLREASGRLLATVDDVGVTHFDTDTLTPEVERMRDAGSAMRAALAQGESK